MVFLYVSLAVALALAVSDCVADVRALRSCAVAWPEVIRIVARRAVWWVIAGYLGLLISRGELPAVSLHIETGRPGIDALK